MFSGANAHAACNLGFELFQQGPGQLAVPRRTVCANSYEAFCNARLEHVTCLASTNRLPHWEGCWMDEDDLEGAKEDTLDVVEDYADTPRRKAIPDILKPGFALIKAWLSKGDELELSGPPSPCEKRRKIKGGRWDVSPGSDA